MERILLFDALNSTMKIIKAKRPSQLLPFKGNFPLINPGQEPLFNAGCEGKTYLDECEPWIQQALIKAQRIADIEKGFFEYLKRNNLDVSYYKMNGKEKAAEIKRFFNTTILDVTDLEIKDSSYGQL